jgi:hypothetical protein
MVRSTGSKHDRFEARPIPLRSAPTRLNKRSAARMPWRMDQSVDQTPGALFPEIRGRLRRTAIECITSEFGGNASTIVLRAIYTAYFFTAFTIATCRSLLCISAQQWCARQAVCWPHSTHDAEWASCVLLARASDTCRMLCSSAVCQ